MSSKRSKSPSDHAKNSASSSKRSKKASSSHSHTPKDHDSVFAAAVEMEEKAGRFGSTAKSSKMLGESITAYAEALMYSSDDAELSAEQRRDVAFNQARVMVQLATEFYKFPECETTLDLGIQKYRDSLGSKDQISAADAQFNLAQALVSKAELLAEAHLDDAQTSVQVRTCLEEAINLFVEVASVQLDLMDTSAPSNPPEAEQKHEDEDESIEEDKDEEEEGSDNDDEDEDDSDNEMQEGEEEAVEVTVVTPSILLDTLLALASATLAMADVSETPVVFTDMCSQSLERAASILNLDPSISSRATEINLLNLHWTSSCVTIGAQPLSVENETAIRQQLRHVIAEREADSEEKLEVLCDAADIFVKVAPAMAPERAIDILEEASNNITSALKILTTKSKAILGGMKSQHSLGFAKMNLSLVDISLASYSLIRNDSSKNPALYLEKAKTLSAKAQEMAGLSEEGGWPRQMAIKDAMLCAMRVSWNAQDGQGESILRSSKPNLTKADLKRYLSDIEDWVSADEKTFWQTILASL